MRILVPLLYLLFTFALAGLRPTVAQDEGAAPYGLVVHGGAGTILPDRMTAEQEAAYRGALEAALRVGHAVLAEGGSSLDAVVTAITRLEDDSLFNAGKGAVFTAEGTVELDASIMDGATLQAGAVGGVKRIKNPITLARQVMEASPHVMMVGDGAETFAQEQGMALVENDYFYTERRRRALDRVQQREQMEESSGHVLELSEDDDYKLGTVGAVALDQNGNLAAATSTGGMTNKRYGRIGDSPIIGAGTYANNETCAVSATGHGEYFIRGVIAHDIAAMMDYAGLSLTEASNAVIHGKLTERGGSGGVIAIDREGNVAMPFNTPGMYRGHIDADGTVTVKIFRD
jgi:beta-aspartyl-peptidase (threonine type)